MNEYENRNLSAKFHELACRYAEIAQEVLPNRLTSIALYGSVTRGEAHSTSDIDLFVVLKDAPQGMLHRRALLEPVREKLTPELETLWKQGIYVDFVEVIRSEAEARHFYPLYLDMAVDVELLYDRDGFLESVLQQVRERLEALGARRQKVGGVQYWDLKPNLKLGEAIEL
ncbi:MAG: nucleotidyltransferase domain-containing protein [Candidatus Bipolaricaulia bacterium]